MPGITPRMLTRQLRDLEEDGLVRRTVYQDIPPTTAESSAVTRALGREPMARA